MCESTYCKDCEKKIVGDIKHECKQEDLDSVKFVNSLVKCPRCDIAVIRSFGCDNITCSHCGTNFHYITGEKTQHGNHQNVSANLKPHNLEELYGKSLNNEFISIIIAKNPSEITPKSVLTFFNKIPSNNEDGDGDGDIKEENIEKLKLKLLKIYLQYKKYLVDIKNYITISQDIMELFLNNKLTNDILVSYIKVLDQ